MVVQRRFSFGMDASDVLALEASRSGEMDTDATWRKLPHTRCKGQTWMPEKQGLSRRKKKEEIRAVQIHRYLMEG